MGQFARMARILSVGSLIVLLGCGSSTKETHTSTESGATPGPALPSPSPAAAGEAPHFEYFSVIREFGGSDTAALFGLLPNQPGMKITGITGPEFLAGHAKVKILNSDTLKELFVASSLPMPNEEKEPLLSKYGGAQVIYFEKYEGRLCTDDNLSLAVSSTLGEWTPTLTFRFSAVADPTGNCKFHLLGLETKLPPAGR
jgi:hypothetical protein